MHSKNTAKPFYWIRESYLRIALTIVIALTFLVPFITLSDFYFPFIVPRNIFFRLLIELACFIYLLLCLQDKNYLPRRQPIGIAILVFVSIMTLASIFGADLSLSLWSNFERMDGLLTLYHLTALYFIVAGFLRNRSDWERLLLIDLTISCIIACIGFGQFLGFNWVQASAGGERISSTLGNPTYLAAYLLIHIFIALYFMVQRKYIVTWRVLFGILAVAYTFLILLTRTRGALVGLAFAGVSVVIISIVRNDVAAKIKLLIIGVSAVVCVFIGLLFVFKHSDFVVHNDVLNRVASISSQDATARTRLAAWRAGLRGFMEQPILGWGTENYHQVFNQYFPKEIYTDEGTPLWYDRPHNALVQYVVEGGALGFLSYIALLVIVLWICFKKLERSAVLVMIAFLIAYVVQNLFVFDSLNSYIPFYMLLGFITFLSFPDRPIAEKQGVVSWRGSVIACSGAVLILFFMWFINVTALETNRGFVLLYRDLTENAASDTPLKTEQIFQVLESPWFLGKAELLGLYSEYIIGSVAGNSSSNNDTATIARLINDMERYRSQHPNDARFNMFLINLYIEASRIKPQYLQSGIDLVKATIGLSPDRAQLYYLLGRAYLIAHDDAQSLAAFRHAVDLAPHVFDSHWNLFSALVLTGDVTAAQTELTALKSIRTLHDDDYSQIVSVYSAKQEYGPAVSILKEALQTDPSDANLYALLAQMYAMQKNRAEAQKAAEKAASLDPTYQSQLKDFLQNMDSSVQKGVQ